MCVIVIKDKKTNLPKKEYIKNCFDRNPDGAGLMYVDNNAVIIEKGFMTWKDFEKKFDALCKKYHDFKNKSLVIHFRITTDGSTSKKNCHPFSVSTDFKDCQKTKNACALGVAHNGIISNYRPEPKENDISDTIKFINEYIAPIFNAWHNCYKSKEWRDGVEYITHSKFAFLDTNDKVYTCGDFMQKDGVLYSNDSYNGYYYAPKYYGYNYNGYFDDSFYYFDDDIAKKENNLENSDDLEELRLFKLEPTDLIYFEDEQGGDYLSLEAIDQGAPGTYYLDIEYREIIKILKDGGEELILSDFVAIYDNKFKRLF